MNIHLIKKLIQDIPVNAANLEHIAKTGKINGSLLGSIVHTLYEHERQSWSPVSTPPEFGDRYNIIQDLEDGEDPITHSAEYFKTENKWYEMNTNQECIGILFWRALPQQTLVSAIDIEDQKRDENLREL